MLAAVSVIARAKIGDLSNKELTAFKEFAKVLLGLSDEQIQIALRAGDFIEVQP